jgi:hypothetical protein
MIPTSLLMLAAVVVAPAALDPAAGRPQPRPGSADPGVVVLRAAGPSAPQLPKHQVLPSDWLFELRPGDVVYIVRNNWIRVLRGPGRFRATEPLPPRPNVTIRGCSSCAPRSRRPLGGGLWEYDVTDSGSVCVRPGRGPALWRGTHEGAEQLSITAAAGGLKKVIEWPAGQRTLPWPADLPLVDGARYFIDLPGGNHPRATTIRVLPPLDPEDTRAFGVALAERQCFSQFSVLARERLDPQDRDATGGR